MNWDFIIGCFIGSLIGSGFTHWINNKYVKELNDGEGK